jgi:hypothetical protein
MSHFSPLRHQGFMTNNISLASIGILLLSVGCSSKASIFRVGDGAVDQPGASGGNTLPLTGAGGSSGPVIRDASVGTGGTVMATTSLPGAGGASSPPVATGGSEGNPPLLGTGGTLPPIGTGGTTLPPSGTGGIGGSFPPLATGGTTFPNPTARGGAGGTNVPPSTGGAGGATTTTGTTVVLKPVGQTVTGVTKLVLAVNLVDGAILTVKRDETWTLEVSSGALSYNDTAGTSRQASASAEQTQSILDALLAAQWHTNAGCFFCCTDGPPYSPTITITSASGTWVLGVSDATCAPSSRAHVGDVVRCSDYGKVLGAFQAVIPGVSTGTCQAVW